MSSMKLCVFDHILVRDWSEFVGRLVGLRSCAASVTIEFSQPRKLKDTVFIGLFNGNHGDKFLNVRLFDDMTDAKEKLQACRREYNESWPHRSLDELSHLELKAQWAERSSEIR